MERPWSDVWNIPISHTLSTEESLPSSVTQGGSSGGSGTQLVSEPMVEEGKQTPGQASDVSMGAALPEPVSYSPTATEESPSYSTPYPSAGSGDAGEKSLGTSPLRPAKISSIFSQPSTSTQMVRFKKQVPATVELQQNRE